MVFNKILKEGTLFINKIKIYPVYNLKQKFFYKYNNEYNINQNKKISFLNDDKIFSYKNKKDLIKLIEKQIDIDKKNINKQKDVIFFGRLNSGKSSLINSLNNDNICRTSKKGSTTKFWNSFNINYFNLNILDSPGYAKLKVKSSSKYFELWVNYIRRSENLVKIFYIIDINNKIKANDEIMFKVLKTCKIPIQLVFNKIDKLEDGNKIMDKALSFTYQLGEYDHILMENIHLTSNKTNFGIEELKLALYQSYLECPTRTIKFKDDRRVFYLDDYNYNEEEKKKYKLLIQDEIINQRKLLKND